MSNNHNQPNQAAELIKWINPIEWEKATRSTEKQETLSPEATRQMLNELQAHQIKLEMQNEALRKTQAELDAARARYIDLYDLAPVGYITVSEKGLIREANLTAANLLGAARGAILKKPLSSFILKESRDIYDRHRKRLFETGEPQSCELQMVKLDGTAFWTQMDATAVPDQAGGTLVFHVAMSDITGRKQAEESLRKSEEKYRLVADNSNDWIYLATHDGKFSYVSPSSERITGYTSEEFMNTPRRYLDIIHPDDKEQLKSHHELVQKETDAHNLEFRIITKGGELRWIRHSCLPVFNDQGQYAGRSGTNRDVTLRKQAEEALLESVARFKALFNATSDSVILIKPDGTILDLNKTASDRYGVNTGTMVGKNIFDFLPPESASLRRSAISQILNERRSIQSDERRLFQYEESRDGKYYSIRLFPVLDENGKVFQLASFSRDITERKKMEKTLQHAQRMEAIGALAGGIAHDFNNILFPIIGMSDMLMGELPAGSPDRENLGVILKAAQRAGELVKQILSFSRQVEHEKMPVRVQYILKEVLKLTRSTIPSNIEITQSIQKDCGLVMADPTQLHQIAMNLITNAYHAVEASGGSISIQLKEEVLIRKDLGIAALEAGKYAMMSISDTGHGIDPAVMGKIFEPYFTTKEVGKGTGLGLSVVHGIVKEHGGDIRVYSEPGKGATFRVYLPILKKNTETPQTQELTLYETGTERILLVDDEEPIVHIMQVLLEKLGYRVTALTSSPDALAMFRDRPDAFDVVITDMTMPKITGNQLAAELRVIKPNVPIIICTGFSDKIDNETAAAMGLNGFLMKPVVKSEMAKMIRNILDKQASIIKDR